VAAQLTTQRLKGALTQTRDLTISARVLSAICAGAVVVAMASVIIGAWDANREEEAALQRYADTEALLALPPVDTAALETQRDEARRSLAAAEALLEPPSIDLASDEATILLVSAAGDAGLNVRSVARVAPSELKRDAVIFDIEGVRLTVEGSVSDVLTFIGRLHLAEPGFIPALGSMTIDDRGVATTEVTVNAYTKQALPTPAAAPGGAP